MRLIKLGGFPAPAGPLQEAAIGFQHPRRRGIGGQRLLVGRIGGGTVAQIVLDQRGMEGRHAFGALLLDQRLQVLLHSGGVMQGRRRPGVEQRQGQHRERTLGRQR